jgi:protein TonB
MVSQALPVVSGPKTTDPRKKKLELAARNASDTFIAALLEVPCEYKHRNPWEWAVSVVVNVVAVSLLIAAPLYFTQSLDLKAFQNTWLVAPAPPAPPPPPAAPMIQRTTRTVARLMQAGKLTAPTMIPKRVAIIKEESLPPDTGGVGVIGGVPGGIPGGQVGGVLGGIIGGTGSNLAAAIAPPPSPVKRVLRVGGNIRPPRQIYAPAPEYPIIAKQAQVQGTAIIDAIIDEKGNVVQAHAVSGPGLLLAAALQAVASWKYEPTLLNGEPTSVEMHVEVHFFLQ